MLNEQRSLFTDSVLENAMGKKDGKTNLSSNGIQPLASQSYWFCPRQQSKVKQCLYPILNPLMGVFRF